MRLDEKFAELEGRGQSALILYIACGDPTAEDTIKLANRLISAGCDIIELGLPFSDPIADGKTIQEASQRAICGGMDTDNYFRTCAKIHGAPKVCMTYYNLIYQYGLKRFAESCRESGITGLIVPDLPPEEAEGLLRECCKHSVDYIPIVSPKTSEKRLEYIRSIMTRIPEGCSMRPSLGFVYLQAVLGITGARKGVAPNLSAEIKRIAELFGAPVSVGFGVSEPGHARDLAKQGAGGIIIGSALINKISEGADIERYVSSLKEATSQKDR